MLMLMLMLMQRTLVNYFTADLCAERVLKITFICVASGICMCHHV